MRVGWFKTTKEIKQIFFKFKKITWIVQCEKISTKKNIQILVTKQIGIMKNATFQCLSYSLWLLYKIICFSKPGRNKIQFFFHSQGRWIFFLLDKHTEFVSPTRKKEIHEIGTETFDNHEYLWNKFVELLIA